MKSFYSIVENDTNKAVKTLQNREEAIDFCNRYWNSRVIEYRCAEQKTIYMRPSIVEDNKEET